MATRTPPMTAKRLHEFVKAYAPSFPDWSLVNDEYFIRFEGPVAQVVGFEALRSGAYRPANGIRILVAPKAAMLLQFLDIKHRETFATEHEQKMNRVIEAMENQFHPSIRRPLNPKEVLELCEASASEKVNDAYALSALNASCGNRERAIEWLNVLSRLTEQSEQELFDWEQEYMGFGKRLRVEIESQNELAFLKGVQESEKVRLLG